MKSDNWPIEIDGKKFKIDRTFGNEPAIYKFIGKKGEGELEHISGGETNNLKHIGQGIGIADNKVIIIATITD